MLRAIGFNYAERIDPFDGGPHFHARTDEITLVKATRRARVVAGEAQDGKPAIVASTARRRRTSSPSRRGRPAPARWRCRRRRASALGVGPGDEVGLVYLER